MKILTKLLGLILLFALFACNQDGNQSFGIESEEAFQTDDLFSSDLDDDGIEKLNIGVKQRKLITEGNIQFQIENIDQSRKKIAQAVKNNKGYISSEQEYKSSNRISNVMVIRVPVKNFDKLLSQVSEGVSKFDSKNIEVKDVTEEFLDIEIRLKTKKELEARYLELLKKANNVSEILQIEGQVGTLRTEIESVEGRLRFLKNKIGFSTLTITFYEKIPSQTEFGNEFKDGFTNGWENLIWFFVVLTNLWPFILISIVLISMFYLRKKRKNKKSN